MTLCKLVGGLMAAKTVVLDLCLTSVCYIKCLSQSFRVIGKVRQMSKIQFRDFGEENLCSD